MATTQIRDPTSEISVRHVWDERDLPGALDRRLEFPLMHRAGARDAPRENLAALGDEWADHLHVFVIDGVDAFDAELTNFFPAIVLLLTCRTLFLG